MRTRAGETPPLARHCGPAWPRQREEFEAFNGPVLVTTNRLIPPKVSYLGRLYHQPRRRARCSLPTRWPRRGEGLPGRPPACVLAPGAVAGELPGPRHGPAPTRPFALAEIIVEALKEGDINRFW
jgi:hydroxylamine reductase